MNLRLAFLALLTVALFSCEKDDEDMPCPPTGVTDPNGSGSDGSSSFEYVNSVGSYWVYQWYRIDANGDAEQMNRRDSIYIVGDSILNGVEYTVYSGSLFPSSQDYEFYRDSSGYILNDWGNIAWTYVNFGDTLGQNDVSPEWSAYSIMLDAEEISTPSGDFSALRRQARFYRQDGELATSCGDEEIIFTTNYASGVGRIQHQIGYITPLSLNCEFIEEARLVDYFIAP